MYTAPGLAQLVQLQLLACDATDRLAQLLAACCSKCQEEPTLPEVLLLACVATRLPWQRPSGFSYRGGSSHTLLPGVCNAAQHSGHPSSTAAVWSKPLAWRCGRDGGEQQRQVGGAGLFSSISGQPDLSLLDFALENQYTSALNLKG